VALRAGQQGGDADQLVVGELVAMLAHQHAEESFQPGVPAWDRSTNEAMYSRPRRTSSSRCGIGSDRVSWRALRRWKLIAVVIGHTE